MLKTLLIYICLFFCSLGYSQQLFYSDIFYGGVTASGFGLEPSSNGSGFINVNIPNTSSIRKAYLLSGRHGNAPSLMIDFNGTNLIFNDNNKVGSHFKSFYGDSSYIHIIDVTSEILPTINSYPITVSTIQQSGFNRYNEFYLYVLYEDNLMPTVNSYLFINNDDFGYFDYNLYGFSALDSNKDVSLSLFCGYICDTNSSSKDGEYIYINNNLIGLIGGLELNSVNCAGPFGNFYYQNNQLFGLNDDTANFNMNGSDLIAKINPYIVNNDTSFNLDLISQSTSFPNNESNALWSVFLTYSNDCDTFTTSISTTNDTICPWGSTQLQATGGSSYSWFGAFGGLNDTSIANPIASPNQTTTYICTITNDSGCVKTEQVKVWVDACVGINDKNTNTANVSIYPNPSNGNFTITSDEQLTQITISNTLGQVVYQQLLNNYSADLLLNAPKGLYFVTTKTAKGSFTQKLVKE